jgi:hypothetical protein
LNQQNCTCAPRQDRHFGLPVAGTGSWEALNPRGRDIVVQVNGYSALDASYQALLPVVRALDDGTGWRSTRCAGWTVRDLVHHLLADAQRALVALHTPACGPTDVDAVSYWRAWQPDTPGADAGRRGTRIMASAWSSVEPIAALYVAGSWTGCSANACPSPTRDAMR